MTRPKKWSDENLIAAVKDSLSVRQVIKKLGLIEAGGNYVQVQQRIKDLNIDISHFTGKGWNKGGVFRPIPLQKLSSLLINGSLVQSHKLKKRLFREGLKKPQCELCNWSKESLDGRIPVELDHINGNRFDNRIENLRILCPNCHSLQPTHRGKNKKKV